MVNVEESNFGLVLRKLREKRGLSLSELATKARIFRSNLANMEAGRIRVGPRVFARLSKAVALGESDQLEMALAFAASRIQKSGSTSEQVRTEILLMLSKVFRGAGIDLQKVQNLELVEFKRPMEDAPPVRAWFAYENGARPQANHKEKIIDAFLNQTAGDALMLAVIRRNRRVALIRVSELPLAV